MKDYFVAASLGDVSEGFFDLSGKSGMQYVNLIGCLFQCCFYKTADGDSCWS